LTYVTVNFGIYLYLGTNKETVLTGMNYNPETTTRGCPVIQTSHTTPAQTLCDRWASFHVNTILL